jgi:RNA polymerase sigma factor (sigma-70 family)
MKYEDIRRNLIEMFIWRIYEDPESLADETINRVARKVRELKSSYSGDPARYFYGVAKMVALEQLKKAPRLPHVIPLNDTVAAYDDSSDELNRSYEALDKCLDALSEDDRRLILEYYAYTKVEKVNHRKELAKELKLTQATLRKRVQRIRKHLRRCMEEELGETVRWLKR